MSRMMRSNPKEGFLAVGAVPPGSVSETVVNVADKAQMVALPLGFLLAGAALFTSNKMVHQAASWGLLLGAGAYFTSKSVSVVNGAPIWG